MRPPTSHFWMRNNRSIAEEDRHAGLLHGRTARRQDRGGDRPTRVGAGASFHGGGLVTPIADSPHLLAPKIKARMYFGIAANDDKQQPDAKDKLKEAFAAAKVPAEIEVYSQSQHGWCVSDMPAQNGKPIYNKPDAEKAWAKLRRPLQSRPFLKSDAYTGLAACVGSTPLRLILIRFLHRNCRCSFGSARSPFEIAEHADSKNRNY